MKIAIANDHAGVEYKNILIKFLKERGYQVINKGTDTQDSCDYPDYAKAVVNSILSKESDFGVLICGTGVGMSICANRFKGIRASLCTNTFVAQMTREHNNSNVLCLGARVIAVEEMLKIADAYFSTEFSELQNPDKHTRRINKIEKD